MLMPQPPSKDGTSPWYARLVLALYLCGLLLPSLHFATVEHAVCAEDGMLVHVVEEGCGQLDDHGEESSHDEDSDDEHKHEHENCLADGIAPAALSMDGEHHLSRLPTPLAIAPLPTHSWCGQRIPGYRLAPKNSPPRS